MNKININNKYINIFKEYIKETLIENIPQNICDLLSSMLALDYQERILANDQIKTTINDKKDSKYLDHLELCVLKIKTYLGENVFMNQDFNFAIELFVIAISDKKNNKEMLNNKEIEIDAQYSNTQESNANLGFIDYYLLKHHNLSEVLVCLSNSLLKNFCTLAGSAKSAAYTNLFSKISNQCVTSKNFTVLEYAISHGSEFENQVNQFIRKDIASNNAIKDGKGNKANDMHFIQFFNKITSIANLEKDMQKQQNFIKQYSVKASMIIASSAAIGLGIAFGGNMLAIAAPISAIATFAIAPQLGLSLGHTIINFNKKLSSISQHLNTTKIQSIFSEISYDLSQGKSNQLEKNPNVIDNLDKDAINTLKRATDVFSKSNAAITSNNEEKGLNKNCIKESLNKGRKTPATGKDQRQK